MADSSLNSLSNQTSGLSASNQVKANSSEPYRHSTSTGKTIVSSNDATENVKTGINFAEKFRELQLKESIIIGKKGKPLPIIQPYFGDELPENKNVFDSLKSENNRNGEFDFTSDLYVDIEGWIQGDIELKNSLDSYALTKQINFVKSGSDLNDKTLNTVTSKQIDSSLLRPVLNPLVSTSESAENITNGGQISVDQLTSKLKSLEKVELKLVQLDLDDFIDENSKLEIKKNDNGKVEIANLDVKNRSSLFAGLIKKSNTHSTLNTSTNKLFSAQSVSDLELFWSFSKTISSGSEVIANGNVSPSIEISPASNIQSGLSLKNDFTPNLALRLQWIYQQAISRAEILMDPPELGPISVKLTKVNGETNILFQVANSVTKDMIEENLSKLKELLAEQNINLGDAQVAHQRENNQDSNQSNQTTSDLSHDNEPQTEQFENYTSVGLLDTYI